MTTSTLYGSSTVGKDLGTSGKAEKDREKTEIVPYLSKILGSISRCNLPKNIPVTKMHRAKQECLRIHLLPEGRGRGAETQVLSSGTKAWASLGKKGDLLNSAVLSGQSTASPSWLARIFRTQSARSRWGPRRSFPPSTGVGCRTAHRFLEAPPKEVELFLRKGSVSHEKPWGPISGKTFQGEIIFTPPPLNSNLKIKNGFTCVALVLKNELFF